jgi:endoglucanase
VLSAVDGMANWLHRHTYPPLEVSGSGEPDRQAGPVGFSAAALPYLNALGEKVPMETQKDRLEAQLNLDTMLYGDPATYYDQNLAMFGEGWETHRFRFERNGELRVTWKK